MDHFAQMITMVSSFLWPKQETTRTAFCNYLASEVEALKDKDFQTLRNEAVNFLTASKMSRGNMPSAPATTATDTFTKLKCNFNICHTQPPATSPQTTTVESKNISSHHPSLSLLHYQPTPNSSSSRTTALASNQSFSGHCCFE